MPIMEAARLVGRRAGTPRRADPRDSSSMHAKSASTSAAFAPVDAIREQLPEVELVDGDAVMQRRATDQVPRGDRAHGGGRGDRGGRHADRARAPSRPGVRETRGRRRGDAYALPPWRRDGARRHAVRRLRRAHGAAEPHRLGQDHPRRRPRIHRYRCHAGRVTAATWAGRSSAARPSRRQQEVYTAVHAR